MAIIHEISDSNVLAFEAHKKVVSDSDELSNSYPFASSVPIAPVKRIGTDHDSNNDELKANVRTARVMTRQQVLEESNPDSNLLVIIGTTVYDCTSWQVKHPGGHLPLRVMSGKDATDAFVAAHPSFVSERMLSKFSYARLAPQDCQIDPTTADFRKLTQEFIEAGMFETNYWYYARKAAAISTMFAVVLACVFGSDDVYIHALGGAFLGMFWQQLAFIGHDLGHNAVTHNRELDCWIGLLVGNFLTGFSIGWWKRSHNVHHIVTNSIEHDPDIQHLPFFAVNRRYIDGPVLSSFYNRILPLSKLAHVLVKYQHIFYYPIMAFARVNIYMQGITHALGIGMYSSGELLWRRSAQIISLVGFCVWLTILTAQLPTWTSRIIFFCIAHNVAGILHVQITLSHFCMPSYCGITYDNDDNGYVATQLKGSLDIECQPWMDWFHGGLQFQVVHHLWPRMSRHNLRTDHDLKYHRASFFKANCIMLDKLRETAECTKSFSELFWESANLSG